MLSRNHSLISAVQLKPNLFILIKFLIKILDVLLVHIPQIIHLPLKPRLFLGPLPLDLSQLLLQIL